MLQVINLARKSFKFPTKIKLKTNIYVRFFGLGTNFLNRSANEVIDFSFTFSPANHILWCFPCWCHRQKEPVNVIDLMAWSFFYWNAICSVVLALQKLLLWTSTTTTIAVLQIGHSFEKTEELKDRYQCFMGCLLIPALAFAWKSKRFHTWQKQIQLIGLIPRWKLDSPFQSFFRSFVLWQAERKA